MNKRFNDAEEAEILRLYVEEKLTLAVIRERFGCHVATVRNVIVQAKALRERGVKKAYNRISIHQSMKPRAPVVVPPPNALPWATRERLMAGR